MARKQVGAKNKPKNGNKKFGRNKAFCEAYRLRGMREINKRRRIEAHKRRHPNDDCTVVDIR